MKTISLAGAWRIDGTDTLFTLPGSACDNAYGTPQKPLTEMTRDTVRCLRPRYDYIGSLTISREIDVPEEFADKHLTLFIERVNIASELFIDDEKIDRQVIEITTPHRYNLTGRLSTGKHKISLRLDNSNLLNIDGMASGYSVDTQSIWLGAVGRIELQCCDIFHIADMQLYPQERSVRVKLTIHSDCASPEEEHPDINIRLKAVSPDGAELAEITHNARLYNSTQNIYIDYPISGDIRRWSEFDPALYIMTAVMERGTAADELTERFGMRRIEVTGKRICLNGRPIALRGTTDCGIYPLTGYPPADKESWLKTMRTVREYGMNHVRFHAWCPPEAAFDAADEVGVYVSAEMPLWLNKDVCALETGDDPIHRAYYTAEAQNISKYYGNHPSFVMFSNGNELMGDFAMLEDITSMMKALDPRRIYTMTSNFDHPVMPCEDYLCAFEASGERVRIQHLHDVVAEHTRHDYSEAIRKTPVPVLSFEVGQYCVYPDVDSIKDYSGNLLPVNFDVIRQDMIEKNVYKNLERYIKASGAMAALLYKEDMEAAERTHGMGGFELLGLTDYPGQCTATIGLLDVFWKSKGIITPEKFREACDEVVPLMKAERVFTSSQLFEAELDLYDFGEAPSEFISYTLRFFCGDELLKEVRTSENKISFPLSFITRPSMIRAELSAHGHTNSWNIFVYPDTEEMPAVPVITGTEELDAIIRTGGKAIVTADAGLAHPIKGEFTPVFWSPAFFPSERACGVWFDSSHPVFDGFPTGEFADFQWKHPIDGSVSIDTSSLPEDFRVIAEPVPNFFTNVPRSPLFEAKVGKADILFCGFNLNADDKASRALKNSIYRYTSSDKFRPEQELDPKLFRKLFL